MRRTLAMITAAIATFVLLAPAANAQYQGETGISTDDPTVLINAPVDVHGWGWVPGSTVTIILGGNSSAPAVGPSSVVIPASSSATSSAGTVKVAYSAARPAKVVTAAPPVRTQATGGTPVGTVVASASGEFDTVITAPGVAGPVQVTAQSGDLVRTLTINVQAPAAGAAASGQLPTTGSDAFPLVKIGAVLMAAGAIAVVAARRQRRPATVATNS